MNQLLEKIPSKLNTSQICQWEEGGEVGSENYSCLEPSIEAFKPRLLNSVELCGARKRLLYLHIVGTLKSLLRQTEKQLYLSLLILAFVIFSEKLYYKQKYANQCPLRDGR